MRARQLAFQGDSQMLAASREAVREQYMAVKEIKDDNHLNELLSGAEEAADMLRTQLVQGVRTGEGTYVLNTDQRHMKTGDAVPKL